MDDGKKRYHTFHFDGSELQVPVRLDEPTGRYFLDCPDLEEHPIYTKSGYPWVSVVQDSCPYHGGKPPDGGDYQDCGTCKFLETERPGNLIGICLCEALRKKTDLDKLQTKEEELP
ncbi:MAG: hypothetical protein RRY64_09485 [Oscillospiraceae bacterium]